MIDYVKGRIANLEPEFVVIDTGSWGIKMIISLFTYKKIKDYKGKEIKIYTHLLVRENAIELIGFYDVFERQTFNLLNKVPGIGPRVAISILSELDVRKLKTAVLTEDVKTLVTVPGIGKKTAQKIIIDLKDKIKDLPVDLTAKEPDVIYEAREVLFSLGFSLTEVRQALEACLKDIEINNLSAEDVVVKALKKLSK